MSDSFEIEFPANARIASVEFVDRDIRVHLADGGSERIIPATAVSAVHGATIRREEMHPAPMDTGSDKLLGKEGVAVKEELQYVIAIRSAAVGELWYLVADTFNFRKTLGAEAGYVLDQNLRLFLRKLTAIAPQAVTDGFVTAMLAHLPPPPPVNSLMEFFRTASR